MRRHRLLVRLDGCLGLGRRTELALPAAVLKLERELANFDGYPAGSSDVRGGSESTSVEAAILRRAETVGRLGEIEQEIADIAYSYGKLLALVGDVIGRPTATAADRCHGGKGMDGAVEWGRPDCENLAAVYVLENGGYSWRFEGLCTTCQRRKMEWRRKTGAAART